MKHSPAKRKRSGPPRRGRLISEDRKAFIASLYCCALYQFKASGLCAGRVEVAHIGERGLGQKCSDMETIPLCSYHHRTSESAIHVLGKKFWEWHGLTKETVLAYYNKLYEGRE